MTALPAIVVSLGLALGSLPWAPTVPPGLGPPTELTELSAESWLLYDLSAGVALTAQNEDEPRPMASVTKLMTALVAVESSTLEDIVVISEGADATGEAGIGVVSGERWTMYELLGAVMVRSANDAAVAVAEHVGGSVEGFADMMNARAAELGMADSHFVNPHGLDADDHYTSASDLLTLARAVLDDPVLARLARTKVVKFKPDPDGRERRAVNTNSLLGAFPGVVGLKTGYTSQAGRVLVSVADRGDRTLVAVVMGSEDHFADTRELLEWGFATYGIHDRLLRGLVEEQGGGAGVAARSLPETVEARLGRMPSLMDGRWAISPVTATPLGESIETWLRGLLPVTLGGGS